MPTDYHRRIHRDRLHKEMQLPSKIPAGHCGTYFNIPVYSDCAIKEAHSRLKVVVRPSPAGRPKLHGRGLHKSSTHRVFVECGCKRLVPAGRYHQHAGACDEAVPCNQLAIYERIDRLVKHGRYSWDAIEKWIGMSGCLELWNAINDMSDAERQEVRDGTRYVKL